MLPAVASIIAPPGFNNPSFSAASIMDNATLSLMLPPGFKYSTLTYMSVLISFVILFILINGVLPIDSRTLLYFDMAISFNLPVFSDTLPVCITFCFSGGYFRRLKMLEPALPCKILFYRFESSWFSA